MKNIFIAFIALFITFTSCEKATKKTYKQENTTILQNKIKLDVEIKNVDKSSVGGFNLQPIKINYKGNNYTMKSKPTKHKFYTDGKMKYEVKFKEDGLKLRDKNSNLLWKVKIYADKIKISDNEENNNPFVIRAYDDKIKVKRNEKELYSVGLENNTIMVNNKELFKITTSKNSYVYALLAIKEIPNEHKLFLLAELLNKI
ncbi:hypothetical protein [Tenacibaculum ovolyticum]|uniref:hypothetical protein n=1 Tax=Tenacibaculum ovolyticum TaxID=104270 RepID=UPI00040CAA41|nr:hypothetical protein [Tenacibaculum ovolyticum]